MLLFSTPHRRMQLISYVKHPAIVTRQYSVALHGPLHFYQNKQLELYASRKAKPLTLRQLVFYGKSMNEDRLIKSANYVRTELPVRLSHRLRDMQALPYAVVTREGVAAVYKLYWSAFEKFRRYPQIHSLEDNVAFCSFLKNILDEHLPVIPNLYLGLSLASHHLLPEQLDSFMRRMLVSRISRRVLAEHHLALSASFRESRSLTLRASAQAQDNVGIIYTNLSVKSSIERCVNLLRSCPHHVVDPDSQLIQHGGDIADGWPEVIIDGHRDTRFSYIKEHLDYIVFELLKNALRFTIKHNKELHKPPGSIRATIIAGPDDVSIRLSDEGGGLSTNPYIQTPSDLFSFSHLRNAGRLEDDRLSALRDAISNSRGIKGTVGEQVAKVPSVDVSSELRERVGSTEVPPHIGIGLPMSNVYAGYFGGSLQLVPMDGWGTDVYLRLPKLVSQDIQFFEILFDSGSKGTNLEGIEV